MKSSAADEHVLPSLEDEELAVRAHQDFEAFAELYRRHLCPVYRFVRSQVPGDAAAEDVTAQIFFKALSSAASFRAEGSYQAWLYRIAHNSISSWRSARAKGFIVLDEVPEAVDPEPSPVVVALAQEQSSFVRETVEQLPPAQREVVALRYLEDFSIEEIAGITRRTRGAVRILLHRARSRLRKDLEGKELA
jgi:RNA polymerase sigma-70 factor (ECF subfamily)